MTLPVYLLQPSDYTQLPLSSIKVLCKVQANFTKCTARWQTTKHDSWPTIVEFEHCTAHAGASCSHMRVCASGRQGRPPVCASLKTAPTESFKVTHKRHLLNHNTLKKYIKKKTTFIEGGVISFLCPPGADDERSKQQTCKSLKRTTARAHVVK